MAITYKAGNRLVGLSTDFKPTTGAKPSSATLDNGSTFIESDTGRKYTLNYGAWREAGQTGSIGELLHDLNSKGKSRVVEFFAPTSTATTLENYHGTGYGAKWKYVIPSGSNGDIAEEGHQATPDLGYKLLVTNGRRGTYDFDNIRQFNHAGAVIIGVCKLNNGNGIFGVGFKGDNTVAYNRRMTKLLMEGSNGYGNIRGYTADASGETAHDTGMSADGNWHSLKIEMTSTITTFSVDGILSGNGYDASSGSENELDEKCQPMIYASASGSGSGGYIRYLEAYNT